LSYLNPPPAPAPVIVTKDVGGLVRNYEAQTEYYRETDREVRVHECHSACTMALSLPNVCVYPDSIFKFHQAYNLNDKQTDLGVSRQLFDSYPPAVRARLGTLTRKFKVLSGKELIALGVRDCNAPHIMVARAKPQPQSTNALARVWSNVMSAFDKRAKPAPSQPPSTTLVAIHQQNEAGKRRTMAHVFAPTPLPPARPNSLSVAFTQKMPAIALPKVIEGAQPILPAQFLAYAMIARAEH
jgi:hypothetical protein